MSDPNGTVNNSRDPGAFFNVRFSSSSSPSNDQSETFHSRLLRNSTLCSTARRRAVGLGGCDPQLQAAGRDGHRGRPDAQLGQGRRRGLGRAGWKALGVDSLGAEGVDVHEKETFLLLNVDDGRYGRCITSIALYCLNCTSTSARDHQTLSPFLTPRASHAPCPALRLRSTSRSNSRCSRSLLAASSLTGSRLSEMLGWSISGDGTEEDWIDGVGVEEVSKDELRGAVDGPGRVDEVGE